MKLTQEQQAFIDDVAVAVEEVPEDPPRFS